MPGHHTREGLRSGIIAAAATAGTLIGLGVAHGAAFRPLNSIAHILIGSRAYYMEGVDALVTPLALATHAISVMIWGVLLAFLTVHIEGLKLYAAALAFAAMTFVADFYVLPERLRPGFESGLSPAEIGTVYIVMSLTLALSLERDRHHRESARRE